LALGAEAGKRKLLRDARRLVTLRPGSVVAFRSFPIRDGIGRGIGALTRPGPKPGPNAVILNAARRRERHHTSLPTQWSRQPY